MQVAKDIFYFIGSVLGILAFFRPFAEPVVKENREKWEAVQEKLSEEDLVELINQIHLDRVDSKLYYKVDAFNIDIIEDRKYLRIGTFWRSAFSKRKNKLVKEYGNLNANIRSPYWKPKHWGDRTIYSMDKDYFASTEDEDYTEHLEEAIDIANDLLREYKALSMLATAKLIELPIAPWLAEKRSQQSPKI